MRLFEHDLYSIVYTSSLQFPVSCTSFTSISTNVGYANTKAYRQLMVRYQSKTFISNKYLAIIYCLPTAYHRITFMNDTKRLKVVFLVEYNKHLALARTSALFAGFNLIATGLVNCLIVSEWSKNAPLRGRKLKKYSGEGALPLPRPLPYWEGDTRSQTPPPRCLRRIDTRAFGARHVPPFENPGSAPGL